MRSILILASILSVLASATFAAPTEPRAAEPAAVEAVGARQGDEDDGVGWFVAVPALMKPGPVDLTINVPIPGIPCDKKKY